MADTTPKSYSADSTLYLYTSLTAGSSHIITATSRLETILKANKISFRALDVATDDKARMLWGRRSKGKKLPGLVKFGSIVGDLEQVEEWNEYGELKQQIGATGSVTAMTPATPATAPISTLPTEPMPASDDTVKDSSNLTSLSSQSDNKVGPDMEPPQTQSPKEEETPLTKAMKQAGAEAAKKAGERAGSKSTVPPSIKGGKPSEAEVPALEVGRAKAVEEPNASAETTAAKIPEKVAEEGAKRTSVNKITDEGTKGAGGDKNAEADLEHEPGVGGVVQEVPALEARRKSTIPGVRSPLSQEIATPTITELGPQGAESGPTMQGSAMLSSVSTKDTDETEHRIASPEEDRPTDKSVAVAQADPATSASKADSGAKRGLGSADVVASNEGEVAAMKGVRPQEEDAGEGEGAGTSVGD